MKKKTKQTLFARAMAWLFMLCMLMPMLLACNGNEENTEQTTDTTETTVQTGEQGTLPQESPTLTPDPEKEPAPENPAKTLYATTQETVNGSPRGCKSIKVLAQYTKGLDFDINAKKDTNTKLFYLHLPCRVDLSAVTFSVTHNDGTVTGPYTVDFSDKEISDNERVVGNNNSYEIKPMQSNLPSIMVQIDEKHGTIAAMNGDSTHNTYTYGDMVATVTDEMALENGWATRYVSEDTNSKKACSMDMRGRGNTTWQMSKKPYQIRSENDIDLLGMGRGTTYALLANYRDATGARTQLALDLGVALGLEYTVAHRQVDFFLNGTYMGMYLLTEKVEVAPNRVEIDEKTEFLFEVDQYYNQNGNVGIAFPDYDSQCRFRIHNDDDPTHVEKGKQILTTAMNALYSGNEEEFLKYFDLDSWAKMLILQLYSMNSDAYHGSLYFYYNSEDGKLYACSPWDFDWSFGGSHRPDPVWWDPYQCDRSKNGISKPMLQYQSFLTTVVDLYYRQGVKEILEKVPGWAKDYKEENELSSQMTHTAITVYYYESSKVNNYSDLCDHLYQVCSNRLTWMDYKMETYAEQCNYKMSN